jgi:hypothetical protein
MLGHTLNILAVHGNNLMHQEHLAQNQRNWWTKELKSDIAALVQAMYTNYH